MKKLSYWAKGHVWSSRLLIIFFIYPLLNLIGLSIGDILHEEGLQISFAWCYPLSILFLLLLICYPSNKKQRQRNFYWRQKTMDVLMGCTTLCFILLTGNHINETTIPFAAQGTYATSSIKSPVAFPSKKVKKEKKGIKRLLQHMSNVYKKSSKEGKAGLIILAVLVALLLIILLGSLACSIACAGSEGAAYVVFLVGLAGIIFGLVRVIQRIKKGPRKKPPQEIKSS